ncbi:TetR/AcrR family transcriptional regulator [Variovorax sp. WS11]|uniref:TetR/AcrR family transcriptional regulator n=1 Tax=Variovorax sp. WS11 TaxID=1105204 RepID=UPI000D0DBDC7|nr:TetR/AcrR family transcriptional regulator [Variovorax sp. WS11]NDZ17613.1 TetR/AcrR family transcriptional regulator [Variovorax sp. WS11]PSL82184.1 TetR/AcrR family transcriptional regulator [Variovorax sp. WS11]
MTGRKKSTGRANSNGEMGLRDALVAEGRKMFEEEGAKEISLRALARRLGVSEAAPFKHFSGKEEFLAAIASSGFHELRDKRRRIEAREKDSFTRSRAMMLSYIKYAMSHEGLFNLMIGPRLAEFRDGEFGTAGLESFNMFSNAIHSLAVEHGWPKESLELLSHTAWGLEHGIAALLLAGVVPQKESSLNVDELVRFAIDLLLRAIEAGPPEA